jgi:hypothetical protein
MVFETLAADIAVRTSRLGAWITAVRRRGPGVVSCFTKGLIPWFGLIRWLAGGPVTGFSSRPIR